MTMLRVVYRHPTKPPRVRVEASPASPGSAPFDPELVEQLQQLVLMEPSVIAVLRTFVRERLTRLPNDETLSEKIDRLEYIDPSAVRAIHTFVEAELEKTGGVR